jgi:hypothetical protein
MTALGWPHLTAATCPREILSKTNENCCEDNLSLPFSTAQDMYQLKFFTQLLTQEQKQITNSKKDLHLGPLY